MNSGSLTFMIAAWVIIIGAVVIGLRSLLKSSK